MKSKMHAGAERGLYIRAKELRDSETHAETILWGFLRTKPLGHKFRRQHPYAVFILDFYCHKLKLVIEVDGFIHQEEDVRNNDIKRQNLLEADGLTVIRFTNGQVLYELDKVISKIEEIIKLMNEGRGEDTLDLSFPLRGTGGRLSALILAAGLGTRFKPWTDKHPKALALVNGKTLLQRNVEYLQQYGIYNVVVNVHHFADQVKDIIKKNNGWGSTISLSDESEELLETGGGMLKAKELLHNIPFVTLNVDVLTDLKLDLLIEHHHQKEALITLAIAERSTTRFLLFDENNNLCGWRNIKDDHIIEKISNPSPEYLQKAYSGIAVFQPEVFDHIPFTGKFSLIDVFLLLAPMKSVFGYDHTGDKWVDVGRTESVVVAEQLFH